MTEVINTPGSRLNFSDFPTAIPGKCTICGSVGGDGRKFVDFGLDLEFYGVVYFCTLCFTNALNELGWLSPEQNSAFRKKCNDAIDKIAELEAQNVQLRSALHHTEFLRAVKPNVGVPDSAIQASEKAGSDNPKPAKPSNVRGSKNLSNDESKQKDPLDELI